MFNHEAEESVTCDSCCNDEQNHNKIVCLYHFIVYYFDFMFPYAA